MFRGRKKLQRQDQEKGLVFNWRNPVSSTAGFVSSLLIVGLMAVGVAGVVRIRIGDSAADDVERGTLVLVPRDAGGAWMERRAIEAGPFPVRWNPAADPAYAALRRDALRSATDLGVPYRAELSTADGEYRSIRIEREPFGAEFPPLPDSGRAPASELPREVTVGARVIDEGSSVKFQSARLSLSAEDVSDAAGWRFMVDYDRDGRVLEVTALSSRGRKESLINWLRRGQVTGNAGEPGWLVVESVIQP